MKKLILTFVCLSILSALSAQIVYHRTNHLNIGFGKASNASENSHMDFCVNGMLVERDGSPVGGYIDNGKIVQPYVAPESGGGNFAVDNGIFGLGADGKMYMVSYTDYKPLPAMKWAFQNGPILVKDGVNIRGTSQTAYARSGIGFKSDGTLVVIISMTPITFYDFAELFVQEGCSNAIYLDGGPYVGYSNNTGTYGTLVDGATKLQFYNN